MGWYSVFARERRVFTLFFFSLCIAVGASGGLFIAWYTAMSPVTVPTQPHASITTTPKGDALVAALSTTTPKRIINTLTPAEVVPATGKFIVADLVAMQLTLYQDSAVVATYPIIAKGKLGTPDETPTGFYRVLSKELNHYIRRSGVYMPYSVQFYGNYFIHGPPYFTDGTLLPGAYSGGCIRLSFDDAGKVFNFAEQKTGVFVYDPLPTVTLPALALETLSPPVVSALSYVVADGDTRDVFLEQNAQQPQPIASLTRVMTALVAHETMTLGNVIVVPHNTLMATIPPTSDTYDLFQVSDLLYPLLMESNNNVAAVLAGEYGTAGFVQWMNSTARSLDMTATHFADASGLSSRDVASPDDLFRLATYIGNKKSFIWDITRTPTKDLVAASGATYHLKNDNGLSNQNNFIGGHRGEATTTQTAMVSIFSVPIMGSVRKIVVVVLDSPNATTDTVALVDWFTRSAGRGTSLSATACASCAPRHPYRKI